MSNQIEYLNNNIARLSKIVASGLYIPAQGNSDSGDEWETYSPYGMGEKLPKASIIAHAGALIESAKALSVELSK